MSRPYPYDSSPQALYRPAEAPEFFEKWTSEDFANDELLCAEMSRLAYASRERVQELLSSVNFSLDTWIGGSGLLGRLATFGTEGFVARSTQRNLTVVAFRGTESTKPEDLLADLLSSATSWPGGGQVHRGFALAFELIRQHLDTGLRDTDQAILITGHSLGAGVATLAAAHLSGRQPRLVTFGSPRVGDSAFVSSLHDIDALRFVNCCDVVTRIPPELFDRPTIGHLLGELTGEAILSGRLAQVIAGVLAHAGFDPTFKHLGAPRYIDRLGQRPAISDEGIRTDQDDARAHYPNGQLQQSGALSSVLGRLGRIFAAPHRIFDVVPDAVRAVLSRFGGDGQTVPLRDLADHAPINYISSFTGRLP